MTKKIFVVGGGIIGASAAFHLARAGAQVTLFEQAANPGGLATANSWAWLNASWGNPPDYVRLRMESLKQWRALGAVHPKLQARWCGSLLWDAPEDELLAYVAERRAQGYEAALVSQAEAMKLEPSLAEAPELAVNVPSEGDIDPILATEGFIEAAERHSAKIVTGQRIKNLRAKGGRVVVELADGSVLAADEIVLAAGTATADLLRGIDIGLAMTKPPGLLIKTKPAPTMLRGLVMSPALHARQQANGQIIAASSFTGDDPGENPAEAGNTVLVRLQALLADGRSLQLSSFAVGERPTPADGFPAIGRPKGTRNLYVMVMHSGITLAPGAGSFAACEILGGERDALLTPYHPDRLA